MLRNGTVVLLLLVAVVTNAGETPKYVPAVSKTLVFIGGGIESREFQAFEAVTGRKPSGQNLWIHNFESSGIWHQGKPQDSALFIHFATNKKERQILLGGDYSRLTEIGEAIKNIGRPVFVDIHGEAEFVEPDIYKKTFRAVHDHWQAMGVRNVSYVFHMACHKNPSVPTITNLYPGDYYVDFVTCSYYGPGNVSGANRLATFAKTHKKAFGIAECGGNFVIKHAEKDWNLYWKHLFAFVRQTDAKLMVYLNCNDGLPTADHFLIMSAGVKAGWKQEMDKPRYIFGGDGLFTAIGYSK